MAKRKKYPKLPNGYGSIKYLGAGRRNPYAVHPPTKEFDLNGIPQTPKAICYVDDWMKGFAVLTAYKAGTYTPGMENTLNLAEAQSSGDLVRRILADYNQLTRSDAQQAETLKTFREVYEDFYVWKYEQDKSRNYSKAAKNSTRAAFKNCSVLHDKVFTALRYEDLQGVLDSCTLKHASQELILSLMHQMYAYAEIISLCDKDYSAHVKIKIPDDDEHGVPFSDDNLKVIWNSKADPTAEMLLIMCYSGFRINEYRNLEVNLKDGYFRGGSKTAAGKNRIVPIHSAIRSLVKERLQRDKKLLSVTSGTFRNQMGEFLVIHKIPNHTPHDCRHTFSRLCEKYGIRDNDRKRMLGHAFKDITNDIYGHRELEDLRTEIEKIKACY
mgnify:CR=1 FL=1